MQAKDPNANAAQIELWNGRGGEIWTRFQSRLDQLFEPLTAALLAAAVPLAGETVLEIGCGCGDLSLRLAKACGAQGHVLAVDISARMLARAKERDMDSRALVAGLAPIEWRETDAMLHPFAPCADLVASRFGVMFFADPVAAFINIKRGMKPGSRLALLCWGQIDENPWISVPLAAVHALMDPPPPPTPGAPGPFAFAEPEHVLAILHEAGFSGLTALPVERCLTLGQAAEDGQDPDRSAVHDALVLALESGPVAALLRTADEKMRDDVTARMASALSAAYDPIHRAVRLAAKCWLYQASS